MKDLRFFLNVLLELKCLNWLQVYGADIRRNNASSGGGIAIEGSANVSLHSVSILDNRAGSGGGGGIMLASGAALSVSGCNVSLNQAIGSGGGISAIDGSIVNVIPIIYATVGDWPLSCVPSSPVPTPTPTAGPGQEFVASYSLDSFNRTQVVGNRAGEDGGGLSIREGSQLLISDDDVVLECNTASGCGGAVAVVSMAIVKINVRLRMANNSATNGGALCVNSDSTVQTSSEFSLFNNRAQGGHGGGLLAKEGSMVWLRSTVLGNNSASISGGGMLITGNSGVLASAAELIGNSAGTNDTHHLQNADQCSSSPQHTNVYQGGGGGGGLAVNMSSTLTVSQTLCRGDAHSIMTFQAMRPV